MLQFMQCFLYADPMHAECAFALACLTITAPDQICAYFIHIPRLCGGLQSPDAATWRPVPSTAELVLTGHTADAEYALATSTSGEPYVTSGGQDTDVSILTSLPLPSLPECVWAWA